MKKGRNFKNILIFGVVLLVIFGALYYFYSRDKVFVKVFCGEENTCRAVDKLKEEFDGRVVVSSCGIGVSADCANEADSLGFKAIVPFVVIDDVKVEDALDNWSKVREGICSNLYIKLGVC